MTEQPRGNEQAKAAETPTPNGGSFVVRDKRRRPSPRPRPSQAAKSTASTPPPAGAEPTAAGKAAQPGVGGQVTTGDTGTGGEQQRPTAAGAAPKVSNGAATQPAAGDTPTEGAPPGTGEQAGGTRPFAAELEALRAELEERTHDLQRITAEYANYRKRVERDRALVTEQATAAVLTALLPVLDDIDRAREHGDLVGPFGAVAEQLISTLTKFGLAPFGEVGDAFDPNRHEAVAHTVSPEVSQPSCIEVYRRGYTLGERMLRPALVVVADPAGPSAESVAKAAGAEAADTGVGADAAGTTGPDTANSDAANADSAATAQASGEQPAAAADGEASSDDRT